MARRKYTSAQRKAYETGKAYRLGREGKAINFRNPANKASFSAGYNSVRLSRYKNARGK